MAPGSSSKPYVPPAGTAQAQVAIDRTPATSGAAFAQQVFGPQATTGFGFSAMSASQSPKKDELPIPTVEEHDFPSLLGAQQVHPLLSELHEHCW
eukprot:1533049-Rhodomonas_salina.1